MKNTLNDDILAKILALFSDCEEKVYSRGDIITFADQEPEGVYLLFSGTVEQYDVTPEGNKMTVNIFKPTAFFPMSWAINKTPNTYYFAALTTVKIKKKDPKLVVDFLKFNPDVTFNLLSRVFSGTDALQHRLALAASGAASHRLIYEFLIEGKRFGDYTVAATAKKTNANANLILVHVRHNSLAARTGLARETVSRELHKLESDGAIVLQSDGILLNMSKLEKVLDVDV